jgi:hypothetical protein
MLLLSSAAVGIQAGAMAATPLPISSSSVRAAAGEKVQRSEDRLTQQNLSCAFAALRSLGIGTQLGVVLIRDIAALQECAGM